MTPQEIKEQAFAMAREAGAVAVGCSKAGPVGETETETYRRFIADGRHFGMPYLENYPDIRFNPLLLFTPAATEGTVISIAFSYYHPHTNPLFARYAQGADYHKVLRKRLKPMASILGQWGRTRICVDSAPILERYWAVQSGIGFVGCNHCLIVPGAGSYVFIAHIVTEAVLPPDAPCNRSCLGCGKCLKACPGGAMTPYTVKENEEFTPRANLPAEFDASKCISCLTIEHRGDLPEGMRSRTVYGCDSCQSVCPYNREPAPGLPEFAPTEDMLSLDAEKIARLTQEEYDRIFCSSAIKRCPLPQLLRNLARLR